MQKSIRNDNRKKINASFVATLMLLSTMTTITMFLATPVVADSTTDPVENIDAAIRGCTTSPEIIASDDHGDASQPYQDETTIETLELGEGIWKITASGAMNFESGGSAPNVGLRVGEDDDAVMLAKSNIASEDDTEVISRSGFAVVGAIEVEAEETVEVDLVAYGKDIDVFEYNMVAIGTTPDGVTKIKASDDHGDASSNYQNADSIETLELGEGTWKITASGAMNFAGDLAPNVGLRAEIDGVDTMLAKSNLASEADADIISRGGFGVVGTVDGPITVELVAYGGTVFEHNMVAIGTTPDNVTKIKASDDHGEASSPYQNADITETLELGEGTWKITASGAMNFASGGSAPNVGLRVGEDDEAVMLAKSNIASEDDTDYISRSGFAVVGAIEVAAGETVEVDLVAYGKDIDVFEHNMVAIGGPPLEPEIDFVDPTPDEDHNDYYPYIGENQTTIKVSTDCEAGELSAFINWNESLVGYWPFNEETGNKAYDNSTFANDGTLTNGPVWTDGKFGNALDFNGSDNYVEIGDHSELGSDLEYLTLEAWINADSFESSGENNRIISKDDDNEYDNYQLLCDGNNIQFGVWIDDDWRQLVGNTDLNTNEWYHIVATYNQDEIKIYVNGELDGTLDVPDGPPEWKDGEPLYIGANKADDDQWFNGKIDEVRIWNRVLSDQEIKASYDNSVNDLEATFTGLEEGVIYPYYSQVQGICGQINKTETKIVIVDLTEPVQTVEFGEPIQEDAYDSGEPWGELDRVGSVTPVWVNSTDEGVGSDFIEFWVFRRSDFDDSSSYEEQDYYKVYHDDSENIADEDGKISVLVYIDSSCWHEIDAYCEDHFGNYDWTTHDFLVDADGPTVNKDIGKPQCNNGEFVTTDTKIWLNATDPIVGDENCSTQCVESVNWTIWRWSNEGWVKVGDYSEDDANAEFNFTEGCKHNLSFWAVDCLGNKGPVTNQTHYVVNQPPVTVKEYGSPKCTPSEETYITSDTPIYLNATYPGGCAVTDYTTIYYRVWYDGQWTGWNTSDVGEDVEITMNDLGEPWNNSCEHYIEYYAVDCLGNAESTKNQTFYVDNEGPTVNKDIVGPQHTRDGNHFVSTDTVFWLNATDNGNCGVGDMSIHYTITYPDLTTEEFVVDGGSTSFSFEEGCKHELEFYAVDCLGNKGPVTTQTHYVDTEKPVSSSEYIPQAYKDGNWDYINNETVKVITTEDRGCGIGGVGVEKIEWIVYSTDDNGDIDDAIASGFVYDGDEDYIYDDGHVRVTGDHDDSSGFVEINISILEDCMHMIWHRTYDHFDNMEGVKKQWVKVDTLPPVVQKDVGEPKSSWGLPAGDYYVRNDTLIWINATDDPDNWPCNVENISMEVGIWYDGIWNYTWYNVSEGDINVSFDFESAGVGEDCIHYVTFHAEDILGNSGTSVFDNETFYVDNTPPETEKEYGHPTCTPSGNTFITSDTPIYLNSTDPGVCAVENYTIHYRIWYDGQWTSWKQGGMGQDVAITMNDIDDCVNVSNDCKHYIEYYAEDYLGNTEETHNQTFYVDNTPPETEKEYGKPQHVESEKRFITSDTPIYLNATDSGCCAVGGYTIYYQIWYDDTDWSDWIHGTVGEDVEITMNDLESPFDQDCEHKIRYYAVDCLGNKESEKCQIFYVDNTPPESSKDIDGITYPASEEDIDSFDLEGDEIEQFWLRAEHNVINISAEDKEEPCDSGVKQLFVKLERSTNEGDSWTTIWEEEVDDYYYEFSINEDCLHRITWYAVDNLGNTEDEHVQYHRVDSQPPETTKSFEGQTCGDDYWLRADDTWVILDTEDKKDPCDVGVDYLHVELWNASNGYDIDTLVWSKNIFDNKTGDINDVEGQIKHKFQIHGDCLHEIRWYSVDKLGNKEEYTEKTVNLFFDDFETDLSKWSGYRVSLEDDSHSIDGNYAEIRAGPIGGWNGRLRTSVNTTGYSDITLSFQAKTHNMGSSDYLAAQYRVGSSGSWDTLVSLSDDNNWDSYEVELGPGANNQPEVQIRFRMYDLSKKCSRDYGLVDNVKITANTIMHVQEHRVDSQPPNIIKTVGEPSISDDNETWWVTTDTEINLNAVDQEEPCAVGGVTLEYMIEYRDNNTGWQPYDGNITFDEHCTHYLYVKAEDCLGNTAYDNETFIVHGEVGEHPTLVAPECGAMLDSTPTLEWNPVGDHDTYRVEWWKEDSSTIYHKNVTGTEYDLSSDLLDDGSDDGKWCWHVAIIYTGGSLSDWSSTCSFTLDTTPPEIEEVYTNKADDTVIAGNEIVITVKEQNDETGLNGELLIDGTQYGLTDNGDGTYSYTWNVPTDQTPDDYTITATLTDSAGWTDTDSSLVITVIDTAGPTTSGVYVSPTSSRPGDSIEVTAATHSTRSTIADADFYIINSDDDEVLSGDMEPADGAFDSTTENLTNTTIDTDGWTPGDYTIFVRGKDADGRWGTYQNWGFTLIDEEQWRPIKVDILEPKAEDEFDVDCDNRYIPVTVEAYRPAYDGMPKDYDVEATLWLNQPQGATEDLYYKLTWDETDELFYGEIPVYMYHSKAELNLWAKAEDDQGNRLYDNLKFSVITTIEYDQWLNEGWNYLGDLGYLGCDNSVEAVFASVIDDIESVFEKGTWNNYKFGEGGNTLDAIDKNNNYWVKMKNATRFFVDSTCPDIEIYYPKDEEINTQCFDIDPIHGFACDTGTGVKEVMLTVYDENESCLPYWNGTNWVSEETFLPCIYDENTYSWYYPGDVDLTYKSGHKIILTVCATDYSGCTCCDTSHFYFNDTNAPVVTIEYPEDEMTYDDCVEPYEIWGNAYDEPCETTVTDVNIVVKEKHCDIYWDGTSWIGTPTMINCDYDDQTGIWCYQEQIGWENNTEYTIFAYAKDVADNTNNTNVSFLFECDTQMPCLLTIDPPSFAGEIGIPYDFELIATNVPSGHSTVKFEWNFGDGNTDSIEETVNGGKANTTITNTYSSAGSYGLVAVVKDTSDNTLADSYALVTIGDLTGERNYTLDECDTWEAADSGGQGVYVDTWNISTMPTGCSFDIFFDAYNIPDRFIVEYPIGNVVLDTGWRGSSSYEGSPLYPGGITGPGSGQVNDIFTKAAEDFFKVTIIGPQSSTAWTYSIRSPCCTPPLEPKNPTPANEATDVAYGSPILLKYEAGHEFGEDIYLNIYIATDSDPYNNYDYHSQSGPHSVTGYTQVSGNHVFETQPDTTYFWQIVAETDCGAETFGPVWQFTTKEAEDECVEEITLSKKVWNETSQEWDDLINTYHDDTITFNISIYLPEDACVTCNGNATGYIPSGNSPFGFSYVDDSTNITAVFSDGTVHYHDTEPLKVDLADDHVGLIWNETNMGGPMQLQPGMHLYFTYDVEVKANPSVGAFAFPATVSATYDCMEEPIEEMDSDLAHVFVVD